MIDPARPPWREPRSGHGRLEPVPFYRPRNPRATPLWKLAETHYERLRGEWEKRFEARFGFWRGLADEAVARYLDCGIPEMGFARLRCDMCRRERLLTFSRRTRQLCPHHFFAISSRSARS